MEKKVNGKDSIFSTLSLGVKNPTWDSAKDAIRSNLNLFKPTQVVTLTPEMCLLADRDPEFRDIIKNANVVVADGVGVVWGEGHLTGKKPEKIPGIDLATWAIEETSKINGRVFLLGAKEEIVKSAVENLINKFPGLNISGWHNGYFESADENKIADEIAIVQPHLLLVGMGSPRQEFFITHHLHDLNCAVAIGVGGSFDVWSGAVKRAPEFFRITGTEWLYRTFLQPRARFHRLGQLWMFVLSVLKKKVGNRRK
jgi:N-acetylglucosaminyldiphosphoundecaprenol N-acetyl-beta-D-mannosaminyltransferase